MAEELQTLADLEFDDKNANTGTDRGRQMLKDSLERHGAGRSILVDKNDRIIAGNKTAQAAADAGIQKIRVVEITGDELLVAKRVDLDLDDPETRHFALMDNRVPEVDLEWNPEVVAQLQNEGVDIDDLFLDEELDQLFDGAIGEEDEPEADEAPPETQPQGDPGKGVQRTRHRVVQLPMTEGEYNVFMGKVADLVQAHQAGNVVSMIDRLVTEAHEKLQ